MIFKIKFCHYISKYYFCRLIIPYLCTANSSHYCFQKETGHKKTVINTNNQLFIFIDSENLS